jgi:DNA polymerase III alpha subunit
MKLVQLRLDTFFSINTTQSVSKKEGKLFDISAGAKTLLEPLFVRSVPDDTRYTEQLAEEYELIDKNQFAPVFLQVRKVLEIIAGMNKPPPHIIRGSAGSSLVTYLLGITHVDPIVNRIELARFMNILRKDMPDIDIDVPYNRREEIYGLIGKAYPGQVGRVSNYCLWTDKINTRQSIKDVLISHGKAVPAAVNRRGPQPEKFLNAEELAEFQEIKQNRHGTLKNYSKHCGGIVIFEEQGEVPEDLRLKEIESNGVSLFQINLNKDDTEAKGHIKIDLLSNRGLAQLADICPERPLISYPKRDAATERIFAKGLNIGITLGESRGMRKLFIEMKPQGISEIAVALALIRPAAAAEGRKQEFLEKWRFIDKNQTPLTRPIVYDDDAIHKIRYILGCDSATADRWRKSFAKGNPKMRIEFRQAMGARGYAGGCIDQVVDDLSQLVYYSFCKSHAVSYAQLVWALGYWKAHRPHEFWCSALNHCNSEYRKWVHYREARCSGLLLPRAPPPYRVGRRDEMAALVPVGTQEQTLLKQPTAIEDFKELGYWTGADFLPTCGLILDAQLRLDGKRTCSFRGIIACGRQISRDHGVATLICIGVGNREYIDLVIPNQRRGDLFSWAVVEGKGIQTKPGTVEVIKISGVAIRMLN